MTEEHKATKTHNAWAPKGLGWLPDYPDLRDYQLDKEEIQKGGRLAREEATADLEGLADSVINALRLLHKKSNEKSDQKAFVSIIENLQGKVFGNIRFLNVKLRKILRPTSRRLANLFPSLSNSLYYQDALWNQSLHELKNYLYLHLLRSRAAEGKFGQAIIADIQGDSSISHQTKESLEKEILSLEDIYTAITWIRDTTFDEVTIALVKFFQKDNDRMKRSGIVDSPTYNKLSKTLYEKDGSSLSLAISDVKLISISSLVPCEAIEAIFEELIKVCTKELAQPKENSSKKISAEEEFFQPRIDTNKYGFLIDTNKSGSFREEPDLISFKSIKEAISLASFSLEISPSPNNTNKKEETIRQWLIRSGWFCFTIVSQEEKEEFESITAQKNLFLTRICQVFNNEFKVIEPLVAAILKLIMPLASAGYQNWFEAVTDGFKQFEKVIDELVSSEPFDVNEKEFLFFLVAEALQKMLWEHQEGFSLVEDEVQELNSAQSSHPYMHEIEDRFEAKQELLIATRYFYFLIKHFSEYYCKKIQTKNTSFIQKYEIGFSQNSWIDRGSFFDKHEVLEIEKPEQFYRGDRFSTDEENRDDVDGETNGFELFPTETLQIPILITLSRLLGLTDLDQQTSAYLFLPSVVDLSFWCTPIEDQGNLKSCTAMAGVALMEYFVNRSQGKYTDLSPLFLYKVARNQLNLTNDVGASLRETIKAMALHGVPPESVWEYDPAKVDEEPPPFCYSYAQNYQALKYFRLDYAGISLDALLFQIKAVLTAGFPCMFGFTIYTSAYEDANAKQGWIPFPDAKRDKVKGGHAVVAVGYDDYQAIPRADRAGFTLGAFLIRNCWGKEWGKGGYGWLPYEYVRRGLTYDWWSLLKAEWFESDLMGAGASDLEGPKWPLRASLDGAFWMNGPGQSGVNLRRPRS